MTRSVTEIGDVLRECSPQVVGILARMSGDFAAAEDATQEALLAAARHWPLDGVPEHPRAWLVQTGRRKLVDAQRTAQARQRREAAVVLERQRLDQRPADPAAPADQVDLDPDRDDSLVLLMLCCHPALSPASSIALTLRAVGGLSTAEIARAFVVPEATMGQRISRAKQQIRAAGGRFTMPTAEEEGRRLRSVRQVLYLIFNEGYASSGGADLQRRELADEAIRLARLLLRARPGDAENAGLLALMLLVNARREARSTPQGDLVPLPEQDRTRWHTGQIAEGLVLLDRALAAGAVGEYQLQAAIAAEHDRAATAAGTDWARILALYELLERMTSSPVVALNRAVAAAMAHGPSAGIEVLDRIGSPLREQHRWWAVRAHLLESGGNLAEASDHYRIAAARATNLAEQRYLTAQAARLHTPASKPPGGSAP